MNYLIALCIINLVGLCVVGWKYKKKCDSLQEGYVDLLKRLSEHTKVKCRIKRTGGGWVPEEITLGHDKITDTINLILDYLKVEEQATPETIKLVKRKG